MPTVLTEVDNFDATITVPAAGDARTAASVQTPFQALCNRSRYLARLINGGTFTLSAPLTFAGAVNVTGNMTIGNAAGNSHVVNGSMVFQNTLQANSLFVLLAGASALIEGPMILSGAGRVRWRTVSLGDSNATITPQTADFYYIGPTTLSSNSWILTISDASCQNGDWIVVANRDVTNSIQVNAPGAVPLISLTADPGSALRSWALFVRVAGIWVVVPIVG